MPDSLYEVNTIRLFHPALGKQPFVLSHAPLVLEGNVYTLCGQWHPAIPLTKAGKPKLVLPCFYFGEKNGILPAFGQFTEKVSLVVKPNDSVFVIADNQVLPLKI